MSKYNVDVCIAKYRNELECPDTYKRLIDAIEDIFKAFYSSVISLRMFFYNQYNELNNTIKHLEDQIISKISNAPNRMLLAQSMELTQDVSVMLENWLSIRYRMDNTVMYLHKGETLDDKLISKLFKSHLTITKIRPNISELKNLKEKFKKQPWNLCSYYGLKADIRLLGIGIKHLKEIIKKGSLNSHNELLKKAEMMVCFKLNN